MATFKLTINPGYVPNWTSNWEALREFVQNALDAHDKGHEFRATWNKDTKQLKLVNIGTKLDRRHLLLGATSKADDPMARGHFGEGFKLALLVLARNKVKVRIRTGGETWHPEIIYSDEFESELLQIRTTPSKDDGNITVVIDSVTEADWENLQTRVLYLRKKQPARIKTWAGDLLTDPDEKGRVFVKGIFVFSDPKLAFGYDFSSLTLDRDRKMANVYELESSVRSVTSDAISSGKMAPARLLEIIINGDSREASSFETYGVPLSAGEAIKEAFEAKYGKDTIPVSSMAVATELQARGTRTMVGPRSLEVLFKSDEVIAKLKEEDSFRIAHIVQLDELTEAESEVWRKGLRVLNKIAPNDMAEYALQVVTFASKENLGTINFKERLIRVARSELRTVGKLLATVIHELAHRESPDHSLQHAQAMEALFEKAIDEMS